MQVLIIFFLEILAFLEQHWDSEAGRLLRLGTYCLSKFKYLTGVNLRPGLQR